ncbi:hypothetical protein M426DRAFT_215708 [Hypoxylon sp. CI-4A]|nr:hypothetical protein M426DRAFT_215708 [Hypoxylon sp. CI-4A]
MAWMKEGSLSVTHTHTHTHTVSFLFSFFNMIRMVEMGCHLLARWKSRWWLLICFCFCFFALYRIRGIREMDRYSTYPKLRYLGNPIEITRWKKMIQLIGTYIGTYSVKMHGTKTTYDVALCSE